jgi:predicted PhzF superfamily epimerase YddE/YHI9
VHHGILEASRESVTFKGKQSEAIGRDGIVTVTVEIEDGKLSKVQVGGYATIAFKTELTI